MTLTGDESAALNPLTLMESAREKYTLARARREVPELALLSIHGAIEDTLRAHLLRIGSPVALGSFAGVLEAMQELSQAPLSAEEADAVRRLHRLRGRIARGEHLAVTGETLAAYQRLAAIILPRYGIQVLPPAEQPSRSRPTQPMRAQTTLPDDAPVRVRLRDRHTLYDEAQRIRSLGDQYSTTSATRVPVVPSWVAPVLIVVSIFIIGIAVALLIQNPAPQTLPTVPLVGVSPLPTEQVSLATETSVALPTSAPVPTSSGSSGLTEGSSTAVPGGLSVGRKAIVSRDIPALNLRVEPGINAAIQVILAPGTEVEVIAGPVERDGLTWWQVRSAGIEGWCAGEFLQSIE
jgi:hypothetical protein